MTKYGDFILESQIYNLILESKVQFSKDFMNVLVAINNPIAKAILKLNGQDKNVNHNYVDIDKGSTDMVTFIQDKRAQAALKELKSSYRLDLERGKHLKTTEFKTEAGKLENEKMFEQLGLKMSESRKGESGLEVKILAEMPSPTNPAKTWCSYQGVANPKIQHVVNKEALVEVTGSDKALWTTNRNPLRIGRLIGALLPATGEKFTDAEVEKFVNEYKAMISILNDAFIKFDVVSEDRIHYFYHNDRYSKMQGTLGNSCMAGVPRKVLALYCDNPTVCQLVILYDDSGAIVDGKYKADKIKGRAILWTPTKGDKFMDRIYTINQADEDLFKKYAAKNGWWAKESQNNDNDFTIVRGNESKDSPTIKVQLEVANFDYYPYLDSLSYINKKKKTLTNDDNANYDDCLNDTFDGDDDDYDEDDD